MAITPAEDEAALASADALDAAGRHTDAIDTLAGAAQRGGVRAKARIGARLLMGDRAPMLGPQGAGLIAEAANEGDAGAAALAGVVAALGLHRKQDFREALDWTCLAATNGHETAQGALRALAGASAGALDWRELCATIDLAAWTAAPGRQPLCDDPAIAVFPAFASAAVTQWLIGRARPRLQRAQLYIAEARRNAAGDTRTNSQASFGMIDIDLAIVMTQIRIAAAAGVPVSHLEAPAILHYAPGQLFAEHFDFIDPTTPGHDLDIARNGQRAVTALVYLNGAFEGGDTEFPRLGVRHKGAEGEALLFVNAGADGRGDVRTVHAGRAPTAGEKWVLSQFIRNRPVLPGAN